MADMLKTVHMDYALRLLGLHFRAMFEQLPQPVSRFLFRMVIKELVAQTKGTDVWRLSFAAIPLITGISEWRLSLSDAVELGDIIQDRIAGLHFKPNDDGALWVIALNLREPVILTITCLDARVETFTAAALLALFFKGFEQSIPEIIEVPQVARHELDVRLQCRFGAVRFAFLSPGGFHYMCCNPACTPFRGRRACPDFCRVPLRYRSTMANGDRFRLCCPGSTRKSPA